MIEFGGEYYLLNLEAIDDLIASDESLKAQIIEEVEIKTYSGETGEHFTEKIVKTYPKQKEIDGARYEIINMMLSIVLGSADDMDDTLGIERALVKNPLSYKVAFNTLLEYKILVIKE
jgi:hypothetical protein